MEDLIKGEFDWQLKVNANFHEHTDKIGDVSQIPEGNLADAVKNNTSSLAGSTQHLNSNFINILHPPAELSPCVADANYQKNDGTWWKDSEFTIPATDNKANFQAILTWVCNNGYPIILVPSGGYYFSALINTPIAFKQPIIVGQNFTTTRFKYNTISGTGLFQIQGGSGAMCGGSIENIGFDGNTNSYAVEILGACGFKTKNCQFGINKGGILLHNTGNNFTEYCFDENSDFLDSCSIALEYRNDGTQASFHGSGLKGSTINQSSSETNPKILIGANCMPYNAPLNFQCWTRCSTPVINNLGSRLSNFHGNITIEPLSGISIEIVDTTNNSILLAGSFLSNNSVSSITNLILCDKIMLNSNGSTKLSRKQFSKTVTLSQGTTTVDLGYTGDNPKNASFIIKFYISIDFYIYVYELLVYIENAAGNGSGTVTILSNPKAFNQAGYGGFTFAISNYKLQITNANIPNNSPSSIDVLPICN